LVYRCADLLAALMIYLAPITNVKVSASLIRIKQLNKLISFHFFI